jgi:phage tail-like protein
MANYPLPAFHFQVQWGGANLGFSEVTGLKIEQQVLEYRDGTMPEYSPIKQPGIPKYENITLKRGICKGDNDFYKWLSTTKMHTVERRDLIVSLMDEAHTPVMTWKAKNAFPVKIEGPQLKAKDNELAIETLEVTHEGLTIENG